MSRLGLNISNGINNNTVIFAFHPGIEIEKGLEKDALFQSQLQFLGYLFCAGRQPIGGVGIIQHSPGQGLEYQAKPFLWLCLSIVQEGLHAIQFPRFLIECIINPSPTFGTSC